MHQTEQRATRACPEQSRRANPITTGLVTGMGWGLVLGLVDGLPILLEFPVLPHLRTRLQALTYLVVWYGALGAMLFGLLGLVIWGLLRLLRRGSGHVLRRGVGRHGLIAVYSGTSLGLAILLDGLHSRNIALGQLADPGYAAIALLLVIMGGLAGTTVGLAVYGGATWWQGKKGLLRPLRWRVMRTSIVAVFLVGVIALSAIASYRAFLRDLPVFRPKPSGQVATTERPNVVLITVDSLRADHLGAYGYDPDVSPNLDALARRGVVFDQAIAQSSWTVPSTASFLTGLHPTQLGIYYQRALAADLGLDQMRVTLAEVLRQNGYRTQALVTNQLVTARDGFFQGFDGYVYARPGYAFDRYRMHEEPLVGLMCRLAIGGRKPLCAWFDWGYTLLFDPWLVPNNHGERVNHYVQRFLKLHQDERFFLWLFYMEPHINYDPKQPFRPLPAEISPQREQFLRYLYMWDLSGEELLRPVDTQALLSLYDGEIVDVDALIGQVMDELEQKGLLDRTVVIFIADHGEEFMDHGDFTHGHTLYDELVHVPLIVSGPAVGAPGRTVETQVSLLDLVPTVCDIAGAPIPEEVEGRSLVPFLQGEEMEELPAFSEVLHTTIFQKKSVRHDGYKLIYDVESETVELYDVRDDPGEQVDLAEQEPEIVARMMADLETWMVHSARVAAELPRQRSLSETLDEETRQRLRNAGY